MNYGFTTGSCSAAAAKAAAYMLLSGTKKEDIVIRTPKGIDYHARILDAVRTKECVSCCVEKDGGDDPDITTGARVCATVRLLHDHPREVLVDGGEGVGRVTEPGLDQPVGAAAINSVPRSMICSEVREVMELFDWQGGLSVIISVPGGEELAKKTFNPKLGITGGISILGTSGIVEPMSTQAIKDTIRVELRQRVAQGYERVVIAPGNYGVDFMRERYDYDLDRAVKCANYIGETIDMAAELGVKQLLLVGHLGKLIKVSGGIMNTHSAVADCRMELMAAAVIQTAGDAELAGRILDCSNTTQAYGLVAEAGISEPFMKCVMDRIGDHLDRRAKGRLQVECIVFLNEVGLLGTTKGAEELLAAIRQEQDSGSRK